MKRFVSIMLALAVNAGILAFGATDARAADLQSTAGIVATSSGRLNVRSGKSTGSSIVSALQKGSYVTLLSRSGDWWQVEYDDGRYGYAHADYIKETAGAPAVVQTQSGNLNVRSGAGTHHGILDRLPKGETVVVLSESGGWSRVLFDGVRTGYVSSQYLKKTAPAYKYAPVSLSLPSFKQTDPRWADVIIGSSGKPISRIGCTTTAIAMMESYRTGRIIYPDAMSKKLSYTSAGDLYWPSDYQVVFSADLEGVYNQLKAGKPVLYGAKTASGKQHWVVITGYTGGNTLTPASFTVNDPGSSYRVNLQQLLNDYPVFYKYFYYK